MTWRFIWRNRGTTYTWCASVSSTRTPKALLARQEVTRGVTVIAKTDPPMLGFCVYLAAVVRQLQLIHWPQDLFPEIAEASIRRDRLRVLLRPNW